MGSMQPLEVIVVIMVAFLVVGRGRVGRLGATYRLSVRAFRDGLAGRSPIRRCVNCLGAIPDEARFCPSCGLAASKVAVEG